MMQQRSPFEAPGFKSDIHRFEDPDKGGNGMVKACIVVIVLVGCLCGLFVYLRGNESYSAKYEIDKGSKLVNIEIQGGARVYFAPFDDDDMGTDIGLVPERMEILNMYLYEARFIPRSVDDGHFIGISKEAIEQFDGDYLNLFQDKDGIVWIHTSRIDIIPPEVP